MKLTADTITDEQIRGLRDHTGWLGAKCAADHKMLRSALHGNRDARQRCAEIINAHNAHCRGLLCAGASHCECDCDPCVRAAEILNACNEVKS